MIQSQNLDQKYGRVLIPILHHVAKKYDKTLDKQKCAKVAHGLQNVY